MGDEDIVAVAIVVAGQEGGVPRAHVWPKKETPPGLLLTTIDDGHSNLCI